MSLKIRNVDAAKNAVDAAKALSKFKAHPENGAMRTIGATALVVAAIGIFLVARAVRKRLARQEWIAQRIRARDAHKLAGKDRVDGEAVCV